MAHFPLRMVRLALRVLPAPLREHLAVWLFFRQPDHAEPEREQAWRARGTEMEVAGCAAVAFGPADGPAAILMHGWAGRGLQLSAFIEPLTNAGFRVVAVDGPGHGRNEGGLPGLPTMAACLEQAIVELDAKVIAAHSVGAAAAIIAASRNGYQGRLLCLGGPPETYNIFTRARGYMGLPESGRTRFMEYLRRRVQGVRFDDVMDIQAAAGSLGHRLMAILAEDDDSVPVEESRAIVEGAGGEVLVLKGPSHRNIMWAPDAVVSGVRFLTEQPVRKESTASIPAPQAPT